MKILCVHGVGDHSTDLSWQSQWKDALSAAITSAGGTTPQVDFVMCDGIFDKYPLNAWTWAKATALLAESGIENTFRIVAGIPRLVR